MTVSPESVSNIFTPGTLVTFGPVSTAGPVNTTTIRSTKLVATEPFTENTPRPNDPTGAFVTTQRSNLIPLNVVFSCWCNDFVLNPGDRVFVEGEQISSPWAKKVFEVDGKKIILVPIDRVVMLECKNGY